MNFGAEVHDFVKVTDSRLGQNREGNISYIRWFWKEGSESIMEFRFGKLGAGVAGTAVATTGGQLNFQPQIDALLDVINQLIAWINAHGGTDHNSFTFIHMFDVAGNHVGTIGTATDTVWLAAVQTATNLYS